MKRTEDSLRDFWDHIKHPNIWINYRGPRRGKEKERIWENFWIDYSWKFLQRGKRNSQIGNQPTKTKHTERILKAAREKQQITYKGNPICLTADLSVETL